MISNCWPNLRQLSVGGSSITSTGLIHIGEYEALFTNRARQRLQTKRNSFTIDGPMSDQVTKFQDDKSSICTSDTVILRNRRFF